MELLDYQIDAVREVYRAFQAGKRRIILQSPTGAGKTVMAARIIHDAAVGRGRKALFTTHRLVLVDQTSDKLRQIGVAHGVMRDGVSSDPSQAVQVACIPTLLSPGTTLPVLGEHDLIVPDEAHRGDSDKLLALCPAPRVLALTATPCDTKGRSMSAMYDHLVEGPKPTLLAARGYLVRPRLFAPDLGEQKIGDAVRHAFSAPSVVKDHVNRMAVLPGAPTVVFCSGIKHADDVGAALRAAGRTAVVVHSELDDREEAMDVFHRGEVDFLVNASVLVEGWDFPPLQRVIDLAPTKSLPVYLQRVGRGVRPWCHTCRRRPNHACKHHDLKTTWEYWDFANNWLRHGMPFMDRRWALAEGAADNESKTPRTVGLWRCASCFFAQVGPPPNRQCPSCGVTGTGRVVRATAAGVMTEVDMEVEVLERAREDESKRLGKLQRRAVGILMYRGRMPRGRAVGTAVMLIRIHKGDEARVIAAVNQATGGPQ